jgi:phasin family protein
VEKLVELNLQVVKSTLAESQENAQRALSVKDAQELLALQAGLTQPVSEKALSYGRHVYEIVSLRKLNSPVLPKHSTKSRTARCNRWSRTSPRTHRQVRKPLSP